MTELLQELEKLSLVSKICTELANHFGSQGNFIIDKDLAEFIIHLAENSADLASFSKNLIENGAEFTESFVSNIYRIILSNLKKFTPYKILSLQTGNSNIEHIIFKDVNGIEIQVDNTLLLSPHTKRNTNALDMREKYPSLCIENDRLKSEKLLGVSNKNKLIPASTEDTHVVQTAMDDLTSLLEKHRRVNSDDKNKSDNKRERRKKSHDRHRHRSRSHSPSEKRYRGDHNRYRRRSKSPRRQSRSLSPKHKNSDSHHRAGTYIYLVYIHNYPS